MKDSGIRDLAKESTKLADHILNLRDVPLGPGGLCRDSVVELKSVLGGTIFMRASKIHAVQIAPGAERFVVMAEGFEVPGEITNESAVAAVAAMRRLCGEGEGEK